MQGGKLLIAGALSIENNSVQAGNGGSGAGNGAAFGSGLFLQGSDVLTFAPDAGKRQIVYDTIADEAGAVAGGYSPPAAFVPGAWELVKQGDGTLTLTAANIYSGGTRIEGGTLLVNNASGFGTGTGKVWVSSGATLGGSGMVGATTIASGGTLAPGNSIGGITAASLMMNSGAVFEVEINDGGFAKGVNNDHTQVNGAATFADGAIIAVASYPAGDDGSTYATGRYTILDAGSLVVQGDLVVQERFAFLDFATGYDATSLWLDSQLAASSFCLAGSSASQCATGDAVFALGPTNPLYQQIVGMSAAEALAAQNMLSGEIHASAKSALLEDSRFVRDAATDRLRAAFDGVGAAPLPLMAYGEGGPQLAPADTERFAAWGSAFGSWGSFDNDGNAAAMKRSTGGFVMGADGQAFETWRLGLMAGYSHSTFKASDRASSGSSDNYHLGVYGGTQMGSLGFRSGLAYTWHDMETSRSVSLPGFAESLGGDHHAGTFQAFGELGYRIDTATASFEPFANLAYVNLRTGAFSEAGGAAALHSPSQTINTTFTTLGVRASTGFELGGVQATARGMLGWRHASDTVPFATLGFAGGDAFTVAGTPIAKNAAVLEAGLDLDVAPSATLGLSYRSQLASGARDHGFDAAFRVKF